MKYIDRFPESLYPAINKHSYNKSVINGYDIAETKYLKIVGLAHNCERSIERNISRLKTLGGYFKHCLITILENNSTDKTPQLLENAGVERIIEKRSKPDFSPLSPERFSYLAELRNDLLNEIPKEFDYFLVYDLDITGGFSYDGVMHSLSLQKEAVVSNGLIYENNKRKMYDWLAYRISAGVISPEYGNLFFNRGDKSFKINSAFGGMGLYDKSCLRNRYNDNYGCEHVGFHQGLDVWFNPSQIVLYSDNPFTV